MKQVNNEILDQYANEIERLIGTVLNTEFGKDENDENTLSLGYMIKTLKHPQDIIAKSRASLGDITMKSKLNSVYKAYVDLCDIIAYGLYDTAEYAEYLDNMSKNNKKLFDTGSEKLKGGKSASARAMSIICNYVDKLGLNIKSRIDDSTKRGVVDYNVDKVIDATLAFVNTRSGVKGNSSGRKFERKNLMNNNTTEALRKVDVSNPDGYDSDKDLYVLPSTVRRLFTCYLPDLQQIVQRNYSVGTRAISDKWNAIFDEADDDVRQFIIDLSKSDQNKFTSVSSSDMQKYYDTFLSKGDDYREVLCNREVTSITGRAKQDSAFEYTGYGTIAAQAIEQYPFGKATVKRTSDDYQLNISGENFPSNILLASSMDDYTYDFAYCRKNSEQYDFCILNGVICAQYMTGDDVSEVKSEEYDIGDGDFDETDNDIPSDAVTDLQNNHVGKTLDDAETMLSVDDVDEDDVTEPYTSMLRETPLHGDADVNEVFDEILNDIDSKKSFTKDELNVILDNLKIALGPIGNRGARQDSNVRDGLIRKVDELKDVLNGGGKGTVASFYDRIHQMTSPAASGLGRIRRDISEGKNDSQLIVPVSVYRGFLDDETKARINVKITNTAQTIKNMLGVDKDMSVILSKLYWRVNLAAYLQDISGEDGLKLTEDYVCNYLMNDDFSNQKMNALVAGDGKDSAHKVFKATKLTDAERKSIDPSSIYQQYMDIAPMLAEKLSLGENNGLTYIDKSVKEKKYFDDVAVKQVASSAGIKNILSGKVQNEDQVSLTVKSLANNTSSRDVMLSFAHNEDLSSGFTSDDLNKEAGNYVNTLNRMQNTNKGINSVHVTIPPRTGSSYKLSDLLDNEDNSIQKVLSVLNDSSVKKDKNGNNVVDEMGSPVYTPTRSALEAADEFMRFLDRIINKYNHDSRAKVNTGNYGTWNSDYSDYVANKEDNPNEAINIVNMILDNLPSYMLSNCSPLINAAYRYSMAAIRANNEDESAKNTDRNMAKRLGIVAKAEYVKENVESDEKYSDFIIELVRTNALRGDAKEIYASTRSIDAVMKHLDASRDVILNKTPDSLKRLWDYLHVYGIETPRTNTMVSDLIDIIRRNASELKASGVGDKFNTLLIQASDDIISNNLLVNAYNVFVDIAGGVRDMQRNIGDASGVMQTWDGDSKVGINASYKGGKLQHYNNIFGKSSDSSTAEDVVKMLDLTDDMLFTFMPRVAKTTTTAEKCQIEQDFYRMLSSDKQDIFDGIVSYGIERNPGRFNSVNRDKRLYRYAVIRDMLLYVTKERARGKEFATKMIYAYANAQVGDCLGISADKKRIIVYQSNTQKLNWLMWII